EAATLLVGCGTALDSESIRIVDPQTRRTLPAGIAGEIWIAGPHIPAGYWTEESGASCPFGATLAGAEDNERYLRTGDLGVLDRDGELYITGRLKDLIICHGQNFHAQDIEATSALAHPALDVQRGIAFGVDTEQGSETVLLQEVQRTARHVVVLADATAC